MIFTPEHVRLIVEGRKTQTRRVVKSGEELRQWDVDTPMVYYVDDGWCGHEGPGPACYPGRVKWVVGRTYAVQPGRGKPAVARIRITDIRQERLQDISEEDAAAEGVICPGCGDTGWILLRPSNPWSGPSEHPCDCNLVKEYAKVWDRINKRKGTRWQDNPLVWALDFEVVR